MAGIDLSLCAHVVRNGGWGTIQDSGVLPDHLFDEGKKVLIHVTIHFAKFGKIPDPQTVEQDTGILIPPMSDVPEPVAYYIERIRKRSLENLAKERVKEQLAAMDKLDAPAALDAAARLLSDASKQNLAGEPIGDWTKNADVRYTDYEFAKSKTGGLIGLATPWPILNEYTQGLQKGDLWIIAGRPSSGKSWIEVIWAMQLWKQEAKVLFVSMEMTPPKIKRRMDAVYAKLDYRHLRKGMLGMVAEPVYKAALDDLKGKAPLWLVTRRRVKTVVDVAVLMGQLKPDVVFIDGMYKIRASGTKEKAMWERMMEITDALQELGHERDIPIVATTQMNRKGKGKGGDLTNIAFADTPGMNADVVLIVEPSKAMRENKETLIKMGKNREDECVDFRTKFDVFAQDFAEIGVWQDQSDDEDDDKGAKSTEVEF